MFTMIRNLAFFVFFAAVLISVVGIEHHCGDHEIGDDDELFIKSKPSWKVIFQNPAIEDLEIIPFSELTANRQKELIDFCSVRYGEKDVASCYKIIKNSQL